MNSTSNFTARLRGYWRGSPVPVLLAAAVWLVLLAWVRPLTLPDEGRYAGVAWEMLRSGDLSVPLLDGMPYFHKPPLFYWLAALSMRVFGLSEIAARLPSLLIAWAALAAMYAFVRRYRDATAARMAVLVLATTPLFYGGAQFANLDMSVAGMISLCVLAGADTVLRRARGRAIVHPQVRTPGFVDRVEAHGETIDLISTEGAGSVFTFSLKTAD